MTCYLASEFHGEGIVIGLRNGCLKLGIKIRCVTCFTVELIHFGILLNLILKVNILGAFQSAEWIKLFNLASTVKSLVLSLMMNHERFPLRF